MKKLIYFKRKPKKCPSCNLSPLSTILYGSPLFSPELEDKIERGLISLGGCCISASEPTWKCVSCEESFYKISKYDNYIKFTLDNYMSNNLELIYINGVSYLNYGFTDFDEGIDISKEDFIEFKILCGELDVYSWSKEYHDNSILDGTGWELEVNLDGKYMRSLGINAFPKGYEEIYDYLNKIFNFEDELE